MRNELWVVKASAVQVNNSFPDYRHRHRALSQLPPAFSGLHFIPETGAPNPGGCYAEPSPLAAHNRPSLKELINQPGTIYRRGKKCAPLAFQTAQCQPMSRPIPPFVFGREEKKQDDCAVACFEMFSEPPPSSSSLCGLFHPLCVYNASRLPPFVARLI